MSGARVWQRTLKADYGITTLSSGAARELVQREDVLWVTRCCRSKSRKRGRPCELYDSYVVRHFLGFIARNDLPAAILSDKYGLHFAEQTKPRYDIHPNALSPERKREVGLAIGQQAVSNGYACIVFYNNSPLLSKPYFEMLAASGIEVVFLTRLPTGRAPRNHVPTAKH